MINETQKNKYLRMDWWEINKSFEDAVKEHKHEKVKFLLETDAINIDLKRIKYGLFLSCICNDTKMFKYLMFEQKKLNLNTPDNWIESLANSCSQAEQKVLKFILKTPLNPVKFNDGHFYQALLKTYTSVNSLKYLIDNKLVTVPDFYKQDSQYLRDLVKYSRINEIEYLAYQHEISFTPFKDLAYLVKFQHRGDKVLEIISKQNTQELFSGLDNNLNHKTKTKPPKI